MTDQPTELTAEDGFEVEVESGCRIMVKHHQHRCVQFTACLEEGGHRMWARFTPDQLLVFGQRCVTLARKAGVADPKHEAEQRVVEAVKKLPSITLDASHGSHIHLVSHGPLSLVREFGAARDALLAVDAEPTTVRYDRNDLAQVLRDAGIDLHPEATNNPPA